MAVDLKDPFVQRTVLAGLGLAGVLYLFFGTSVLPFCYKPRAARIAELKDEIRQLESDLAKAERTAGGLKALEEQYASLERDWERAQAMLPAKSEVPEFLTGVTKSGLDCGLEVLMFEPKKTTRNGFYTETQVAMKVAGGYHGVGEFLARTACLPRLINVSKLQLREKLGEDEKEQTVEAEMILSAYYLEDEPAPPETNPKK